MIDYSEPSPWKITNSQIIYENNWIKVQEDKVINPAGNPGIYGTVHFKHKAIGIVALDTEGYTYLVGQYRYPLAEYSWEIPMGGGKLTEDTLANAQRELKEETGIVAQKWTYIARIHTSNAVTDEEGLVYLAEDLTFESPNFEETEVLKLWKLPLKEAVTYIMENRITDSITVGGLLKVAILKNLLP